jgi:hypothetical protein
VPTFYSANPEFKGKTGKAASSLSKMQEEQKETRKVKKASATEGGNEEAEVQAQRVAGLEAEGGEINVLDAAHIKLYSDEIGKYPFLKYRGVLYDETHLSLPLKLHVDKNLRGSAILKHLPHKN